MVIYIIYKDKKQPEEVKDPEKGSVLAVTMAASEVHPIEPAKKEVREKSGEEEDEHSNGRGEIELNKSSGSVAHR